MPSVQVRLLKAFLISCGIELPMLLLLTVPNNPQAWVFGWHAFAYLTFEPLAAPIGLTGTPVFAVGLFLTQGALLTPFVYIVLRVWPWVGRKWTEWTDDFLR